MTDQAIDRLVAERDALRARVDEAVADEPRDADLLAAALARAEAAEKERDEAQDALQNLAADHYFARAEAAEARISILERQVQNLGSLATVRQTRCATLEAALRGTIERDRVFTDILVGPCWCPDWKVDEWHGDDPSEYQHTDFCSRARAALAAATPPAEEEVVAAASVLGLSREETDELVRLARSEGIRTQPAEKEETLPGFPCPGCSGTRSALCSDCESAARERQSAEEEGT